MNVLLRDLKTIREQVEKTVKGFRNESEKVAFITQEIERVERELAKVPTKESRKKLEMELDTYRHELEEVDVRSIDGNNDNTNFPLLFDDDFHSFEFLVVVLLMLFQFLFVL